METERADQPCRFHVRFTVKWWCQRMSCTSPTRLGAGTQAGCQHSTCLLKGDEKGKREDREQRESCQMHSHGKREWAKETGADVLISELSHNKQMSRRRRYDEDGKNNHDNGSNMRLCWRNNFLRVHSSAPVCWETDTWFCNLSLNKNQLFPVCAGPEKYTSTV